MLFSRHNTLPKPTFTGNPFEETARAAERMRQIDADKQLLLTPDDLHIWNLVGRNDERHWQLARPLMHVATRQADLARLQESTPDISFYTTIASRLYGRLALEAQAGMLFRSTVGVDIRSLPPELKGDEAIAQRAHLAVPHIQAGMDTLVEAGYLPPVSVDFTGHMPHEKYFWATIQPAA